MIAAAPGKLVLSGAYAVLQGAPALVAAVDRYVRADSSRPAELVTDEVAAAMAAGRLRRAPHFDASQLRVRTPAGTRKLGLGSSAAILVASMAAVGAVHGEADAALGARLLGPALAAHHAAQRGGSGVDVAAACLGGVHCCRLREDDEGSGAEGTRLRCAPWSLPEGLVVAAFACPRAASTRDMLAKVRALAAAEPRRHRTIMMELCAAAERAASAQSPGGLLAAMGPQYQLLAALGQAAGADVITESVATLAHQAEAAGARFGPAGAGGGDVAVWLGHEPPGEVFCARARSMGLWPLGLCLGGPGVHVLGS